MHGDHQENLDNAKHSRFNNLGNESKATCRMHQTVATLIFEDGWNLARILGELIT